VTSAKPVGSDQKQLTVANETLDEQLETHEDGHPIIGPSFNAIPACLKCTGALRESLGDREALFMKPQSASFDWDARPLRKMPGIGIEPSPGDAVGHQIPSPFQQEIDEIESLLEKIDRLLAITRARRQV